MDADQKSLLPTSFEVILVRDAAGKFSGNKTFIEQVEEVVPYFYEQVAQYLRAYVSPPPRMKSADDSSQEIDQVTDECNDTSGSSSTTPTEEEHKSPWSQLPPESTESAEDQGQDCS